MRVWVVGRGIPTKSNGMLGSFEFEQAKMLAKKGVEAVYFAISVRSAHNMKHLCFSRMEREGIPVESFNFPLGRALSMQKTDAVFDWAFRKLAQRAMRRYGKPDVIHVHYPAQRPYGALREWQAAGVRIVGTEHWSKVQDRSIRSVCLRNLTTFCESCDAFICVGSTLRDSVLALTGTSKQIQVVPNVVDDRFSARPAAGNGVRFLTSGRLLPNKQFDRVVRAFIDTFRDVPDAFLTVAGGGEEFSRIQRIVAASGMGDRITLTGMLSREEMARRMAGSSVLVSYSTYETFCVPVVEAWMCGKPTIASSVTSVIIDHPDPRLGLTVDADDPETLKKAMRRMYEHGGDYDGAWIRAYAMERFSEDAVAKELLRIYRSSLEG